MWCLYDYLGLMAALHVEQIQSHTADSGVVGGGLGIGINHNDHLNLLGPGNGVLGGH